MILYEGVSTFFKYVFKITVILRKHCIYTSLVQHHLYTCHEYIPSHVGSFPLHVPVVTVPPFVSSQTLVVFPSKTNPVLQEYVATDPFPRVRELTFEATVTAPNSGACTF